MARPRINAELVEQLIDEQFPKWSGLPVEPVVPGGWDNRTFRLGKEMSVRLPSADCYVAQVEKEHRWLPALAPELTLPIPTPIEIGRPDHRYPWPWSVYKWIEGQPLSEVEGTEDDSPSAANALRLPEVARALADFLNELHTIPASGGPGPGAHNFYRGGSLRTYDGEVRTCLPALRSANVQRECLKLWERALESPWNARPVWVHGDVASGNLLTDGSRLSAVIDFGCCGTGDPACDLTIAWTYFQGRSREVFRETLVLPDREMWIRAGGWAVWKALLTVADPSAPTDRRAEAQRVIAAVLNELR